MSSNPDFANESRVPQIIIGTIIPTVLGCIFAVARLYTRGVITKNWGYDDSCILVAVICSIVLATINMIFIRFGAGRHSISPKPEDIIDTAKLTLVVLLIYQFVLFITKVGIGFFYLRIFRDKISKRIVYGIFAFLVTSFTPLELIVLFRCRPISQTWSLDPHPNCHSSNPNIYTSAAVNISGDIMLIVFVLPRVLSLKMARRQKISLVLIVSMGFLVIIAAIVRLARVIHWVGDPDLTWNTHEVTTWSSVEVSTGIFCASAPAIRPLLRQIAPGFMSSVSQSISGLTKGRTGDKSKPIAYGVGTQKSRRGLGDIEAIALRSQNNDEFLERNNAGNGSTSTKGFFSGPSGQSNQSSDGLHHESHQREWAGDSKGNEIMKTVSITVSGRSVSKSDVDTSSREGSVARFEHV